MSIKIQDLVHSYVRISQHCPITISIEEGSALAICGANGAGKTTMLKLLLGEVMPKKGQVEIPMAFAYLGVKNGLKPGLLIREQLPFFLVTEQKFPWPHFFNLKFEDLSSGQQRLLALWITVFSQKPLILLDEPFSHLDARGREHACLWINQQIGFGKIIIFTAHDDQDLKEITALQVLNLNDI